MDFKSRPVWTWVPNFDSKVSVSPTDNRNFDRVGFGVESSWLDEALSEKELKFSAFLLGRAEISDAIAFFNARRGRLSGFWCPTFQGDLVLASDVAATDTSIDIVASGFNAIWDEPPYYGFLALHSGHAKLAALEITSVVDNEDGTETINLSGQVGMAFYAAHTTTSFLLYVRFLDDEFELDYQTPELAEAEVRVVELTSEYALAELGTRPIWLYKLNTGGLPYYWTSHGSDLEVDGETWEAADITHGEITKTTEFLEEDVEIQVAVRQGTEVLQRFLAGTPPVGISFEIYQVFAPGLVLGSALYIGDVKDVTLARRGVLEVRVGSLLSIAEQTIPGVFVQQPCNWVLYDSTTCKVVADDFKTSGIVSAISSNYVEGGGEFESISLINGDGQWFARGKVTIGGETRTILEQEGDRLYLNAPFYDAEIGDDVDAFPGCDHINTTCQNKFNNLPNFGGQPHRPILNPSITPKEPPQQGQVVGSSTSTSGGGGK